MRPIRLSFTPTAVDTNGLCAALTGAGPWTIADAEFVANDAGDSLAHQLNLTSGDNLVAITLTLTGTDADDKAITEDVTGPNATTVETTKYFKTLTGVSADATLGANTLDIGWVDEFVSQTIPLDRYNTGIALNVIVSGTINYTVQQTLDDVQDLTVASEQSVLNWMVHDDATIVAATANANSNYAYTPAATRLVVNSYSTGATLAYNILSARS